MSRGVAKNTEENRRYLGQCEAVGGMSETDAEVLTFTFDPDKQPMNVPEGVYFDLTAAPF